MSKEKPKFGQVLVEVKPGIFVQFQKLNRDDFISFLEIMANIYEAQTKDKTLDKKMENNKNGNIIRNIRGGETR